MSASPTWLRLLASEDGGDSAPSMSIRPALAGNLALARAEWLRRRMIVPTKNQQLRESGGDGRRLADVLDFGSEGERPYAMIEQIGHGGMGIVSLARQRSTGREVAIKAVHPERVHGGFLDAFRQECLTTAALEHPHIVPVYDAGLDFMVMKRLTGTSFEQRLRKPEATLASHIEVLLKVCDAVSFAHSQGVLHRDLKGENVFVGGYGEVWVMDWGLSAGFGPSADGTWLAPAVTDDQGMCAGTPMCVAPEAALGDLAHLGPSLDLFLMGTLLYRVLCGHYPYETKTSEESLKRAARRDIQPLLIRAPGAPFRLVQAAERATAWDSTGRGTVSDFANDLRTWLHTSGASVEATALLARATEQFAAGEKQQPVATRYRLLGAAITDASRALGLCPEMRGAHELLARARKAFATAATEAGDLNLAKLVSEGFTPPAGAVEQPARNFR
ncbi:MAG: serine/threonine-protein kinase [Planctomycetota bacterium]